MEERKKAGLPVFDDRMVLKTKNVIETDHNEIIISDFSKLGSRPISLDESDTDETTTRSPKVYFFTDHIIFDNTSTIAGQ